MNNTIAYHGEVTVKLIRDGRTIKAIKGANMGFVSLFSFLCKCAGGYFDVAKSSRPGRILLLENALETPTVQEASSGKHSAVLYNKPPKVDMKDNAPYLSLHFLIPFSYISDMERVSAMKLISVDNGEELAYFALEEPIAVKDSQESGYSLAVEWRLTFANTSNQ